MFEPIDAFRRRLQAGETLMGTSMALSDPLASRALAAEVDFLWIDQEHAPVGPENLRGHVLAAEAAATPLVVRLPGVGAPFTKPVLDAGAGGIIVPQVRRVEEVRQVIEDCRYPPMGRRGFGPLVPSDFGRAGDTYVERANRSLFVSVMIETAEAVEAIEDIVSLPGLDSVVLGPWDLSGSLGLLGQVERPEVVSAMEKVIAAARNAGVFVGSGMGEDPAFAAAQARRGVQWLQVGGDCGYLIRCARDLKAEVQRALGPSA